MRERLFVKLSTIVMRIKVKTGATLFKTALKVELFSCFDGRPIARARKKIIAVKMNK